MSNPEVEVKVGILHTIAKSIYGSTDGKIREAVANAIDNEADKFIILADPGCNRLSLFDTGKGISKSRFSEIMKSIGLGLSREDPSSLSYFGLGLMSIFQLGRTASVYSKSKSGILSFTVDVEKIFKKQNQHEPISFIRSCITINDGTPPSRESISSISDDVITQTIGAIPDTFTEIIIDDINKLDRDHLFDGEFKSLLRQILPLQHNQNELFLQNLTSVNERDKIVSLLRDTDYCQHIETYFGIDPDSLPCRLYKYFPQIKESINFSESNIFFHKGANFACYLLFMPEDLQDLKENDGTRETGLWIRNRNFLVKKADNFQRAGTRSKLFTGPLINWTYGEIFHKGMNEFLTVSRDEYLWETEEFKSFKNEVFELLQSFNRDLRKVWQTTGKIEKRVIKPFQDITTPFAKAETVLKEMSFWESPADSDKILRSLTKESSGLESAKTISDTLREANKPIVLSDQDGAVVVIDSDLKGSKSLYTKTWNARAKCIEMRISPDLFNSQSVNFLGKEFTVEYVFGKEINKGLYFDTAHSRILINPFNTELRNYSITFVEFYVAIEIAYSQALNVYDMRELLLKFVGRNFENPSQYMAPLEDDLRRRARCRR